MKKIGRKRWNKCVAKMLPYFQMLLQEEMPGAEGKMKQFASWFTHGVSGGAALRRAIYEAKSGAEILSRVEEFFEGRVCGAGALAREV